MTMAASKSSPPSLPPRIVAPPPATPSRIRAGMGDVEAPSVEIWSDEDYRRATGLQTLLSPEGRANRATLPAVAPEALRDAYRAMLRLRALDQAAREQVSEGRIGSYAETGGYEATIIGAVAALHADDVVVPGLREAGAALYRGLPLRAWVAQLFGNANDLARGRRLPGSPAFPRALNIVPGSQHGGTQLPHAMGIAWAAKMQGKPTVVLAYLDQSATSAEDFHAGLNFAGVFRVPAVFVCTSDRSVDAAAPATVSETLAVKALAYGLGGVRVDGRDLLAVYAAVRAAADRGRRGGGATLIEAVLGDGEPFERLRVWLAAEQILDAAGEIALRAEIEDEVRAAVAAEAPVGLPPAHAIIENVLARPSRALAEQLGELERVRDKTARP
jgi:pyruvate dehydrogenase E1 component alpha subunit